MKFVVESLFHSYHSLGVVGVGCALGLQANPNTQLQVIGWPQSEKGLVIEDDITEPFDYWLRISPGPVPINELRKLANKFIYLPCFESTLRTNWFPGEMFEKADIFACPSEFIKKYLPYDQLKLIWHHGIHPNKLVHKIIPNDNAPLKLLFVGKLDTRKYGDEFINLFAKNFGNNKDVELIVKCQPDYTIRASNYKNIHFISEVLDIPTLNTLYSNCDVLMLPSRGEAFGLTGIEAAASGLVVVATEWGGQLDYLPDCIKLGITYDLIDTPEDGPWLGQWANPHEESIISHIKFLINHRGPLQKAIDQQYTVTEKWSWEATTRNFLNQLKEYA